MRIYIAFAVVKTDGGQDTNVEMVQCDPSCTENKETLLSVNCKYVGEREKNSVKT